MKLPRRGIMVDEDGKIAWAWEHNDPERDFDALPPIIHKSDGSESRVIATPNHSVIDFDNETEPGDLRELYRDMGNARCRKNELTGRWEFTKIMHEDDVEVEVEHPIETVRKARAEMRARKERNDATRPDKR